MSERGDPLLRLLFDAPGRPRAWWSFFEGLAQAISPHVRAVMLVEVTQPAPSTALFDGDAQYVAAGLLPRRRDGGPRIEALPEGSVFELPLLRGRIAGNRVVQKLLRPAGLRAGPGLGVALGHDGERVAAMLLVLPTRKAWTPSAADRALLSELAPFLPQAARLHERLVGAGALTSLLDRLVLGVMLLDDRGQVSYANRSAAELLAVEPGVSDFAPHKGRDARTDALYRTVRREGAQDSALSRHPVDGRPLQLLETALEWPIEHGMAARRFRRALFIGDPKHGSSDPVENLDRLYGLTPSEAKLAWLLVGDFSIAEAAAQLDITKSTARTVLKRILAKTGVRRQTSLVRLLLSGPAQLRQTRRRVSPRQRVRRRR